MQDKKRKDNNKMRIANNKNIELNVRSEKIERNERRGIKKRNRRTEKKLKAFN